VWRATLNSVARSLVSRLRISLLIVLVCLSGCSWFHKGKAPAPDRPELIVTGIPAGTLVFVDGVQAGEAQEASNRSRIIEVTPGEHTVEVRRGDTVAYRESTYVGPGDKRTITVLSGSSAN
jgi:hypothetical protein